MSGGSASMPLTLTSSAGARRTRPRRTSIRWKDSPRAKASRTIRRRTIGGKTSPATGSRLVGVPLSAISPGLRGLWPDFEPSLSLIRHFRKATERHSPARAALFPRQPVVTDSSVSARCPQRATPTHTHRAATDPRGAADGLPPRPEKPPARVTAATEYHRSCPRFRPRARG